LPVERVCHRAPTPTQHEQDIALLYPVSGWKPVQGLFWVCGHLICFMQLRAFVDTYSLKNPAGGVEGRFRGPTTEEVL
jgi:hypothetical protein